MSEIVVGTLGRAHVRSAATCYECRPVVVIDPEDREQVERLSAAFVDAARAEGHPISNDTEARRRSVQGALRSLIAPPRPDEPTGLGAVVEDVVTEKWQRVELASNERQWFNPLTGQWRSWDEINAVRVLSAGWSE